MVKVCTIVGTRPELIKMSRVIAYFDRHCDHILIHTGQNYDYNLRQIFFDDLEIKSPDYYLDAVGATASQTIGRVIEKSEEVLLQEKPDAVLLYGDTNSCLAVIAAKRLKIPVFHMEAGNRCFDQRVPEEINRKVVDHLSDINLVLTEHARRYLLAEGIRPETVFKTGSHMCEVLEHYKNKIEASQVLERLKLKPREYFIVSAHREENVDSTDNLSDMLDSLDALAMKYGFPIVVSTHPRTAKRLQDFKETRDSDVVNPLIRFLEPFGLTDYVKLQTKAFCVISDSGTITEEASLLNLPAITIRQTHERPEGMDVGTLVMSGLKAERILEAVEAVAEEHNNEVRTVGYVSDYRSINVSAQVYRIVLSYIDYVNRTVWKCQ